MNAGVYDEASAWREWLQRAAAGSPREMQIMYGLRGERRLTEWEVSWLPGYADSESGWALQRALVDHVEGVWQEPDSGIWETRGPRQHFVYSKVMAWVCLDRAIKGVEAHGLAGPIEKWREIRDRIHAEVCDKGFDAAR